MHEYIPFPFCDIQANPYRYLGQSLAVRRLLLAYMAFKLPVPLEL
jgi:hypothetical protein